MLIVFGVAIALLVADIGLRVYLWFRYPDVNTRIVNHSDLGYYFRPNHRFVISPSEFITDSRGIIERSSLDTEAELAILFLGDSMLEGMQVPPNANLSEMLAAELESGCQCVNLGISGHSPARYLPAYRHFKEIFQPDVVIVLFYMLNDFNDDARLFHDGRIVLDDQDRVERIKPKFDYLQGIEWTHGGGLNGFSLRQSWRDLPGPVTWRLFTNLVRRAVGSVEQGPRPPLAFRTGDYASRNADLLRNNVLSVFKESYTAEDRADIGRTQAFLLELNEEATREGDRMIVAIMPFAGQVTGQIAGAEADYGMNTTDLATAAPQKILRTFFDQNRIAYVDLLPVFERHSDTLLFGAKNKHLSPAGHELVGQVLAEYLSQ